MKIHNKIIYIFAVVGISLAFFLLGWFLHQPAIIPTSTVSLKIEKSETVKLRTGWPELKILTNTYFSSRNFIFLDNETNDIVSTLSVENPARGWPSYRIVKGHTRDWLVVTRMGNWGTGMQYDYDEWYILGYSGTIKMVLSYQSGGNVQDYALNKNRYWRTDILNESYVDDLAMDIKLTEKDCDKEDKNCSESSQTTHYAWDESNEKFVLKKAQ